MKRLLLLGLTLLSIVYSYSMSNDRLTEYDSWETLICSNEIDEINQRVKQMVSDSTMQRDHLFEVKLVHLAIDCLNPEALLAFCENKIGFYDPEIDEITPFDYFFNENFCDRISNAKKYPTDIGKKVAEKLYWTMWVTLGFQEIINFDENKMLELKSKLEECAAHLSEN